MFLVCISSSSFLRRSDLYGLVMLFEIRLFQFYRVVLRIARRTKVPDGNGNIAFGYCGTFN